LSANGNANKKGIGKVDNAVRVLEATYYGNTYKGVRYTANGDRFNMYSMTCAAYKNYKFGTKLKITNPSNGKSVIVKVTDRGAFPKTTIDLTYGAFAKIAQHKLGRVKVEVQVVSD
jgi:rare lipoprotein A